MQDLGILAGTEAAGPEARAAATPRGTTSAKTGKLCACPQASGSTRSRGLKRRKHEARMRGLSRDQEGIRRLAAAQKRKPVKHRRLGGAARSGLASLLPSPDSRTVSRWWSTLHQAFAQTCGPTRIDPAFPQSTWSWSKKL